MSRILIIIAVLPALILLGFIYMRDRKEKPPVKLMVLLLALGAGTIIPAVIAEFIGQLIVAQTDTDHIDGFSLCSDLLSGDRNCGGAWKISGNGLHYMEKQRISAQL